MLKKSYDVDVFLKQYAVLASGGRILNAGSSKTRFGDNCVNIDIQDKEDVDIVCDLHDLPRTLGYFDAIVLNAVLQYCRDPLRVANNLHEVLKPGGLLFVDAPWIQPYCPDTPDRFRFSKEAMHDIFSQFEILESGPSIYSGSALYMLASDVARNATTNRYLNYVFSLITAGLLYPLRGLQTNREERTAGGFYLVARKRAA